MQQFHIVILSLQETHISESCMRDLPNRSLLILSGNDDNKSISSEVVFIIAPYARRSIITFIQKNDRMYITKLKVKCEKMILISASVPPNTSNHSVEERQRYFSKLAQF